MRQLVTLNARSKEQGENLHTIMMIVSNIQEKLKLLEQPTATLSSHEFENMYKMLPIANDDSLNNFKQILSNEALYDQTVSNCKL